MRNCSGGERIVAKQHRFRLANIQILNLHKISFLLIYNMPGSQNDHNFPKYGRYLMD